MADIPLLDELARRIVGENVCPDCGGRDDGSKCISEGQCAWLKHLRNEGSNTIMDPWALKGWALKHQRDRAATEPEGER